MLVREVEVKVAAVRKSSKGLVDVLTVGRIASLYPHHLLMHLAPECLFCHCDGGVRGKYPSLALDAHNSDAPHGHVDSGALLLLRLFSKAIAHTFVVGLFSVGINLSKLIIKLSCSWNKLQEWTEQTKQMQQRRANRHSQV